jgi:hypothetical protein
VSTTPLHGSAAAEILRLHVCLGFVLTMYDLQCTCLGCMQTSRASANG